MDDWEDGGHVEDKCRRAWKSGSEIPRAVIGQFAKSNLANSMVVSMMSGRCSLLSLPASLSVIYARTETQPRLTGFH